MTHLVGHDVGVQLAVFTKLLVQAVSVQRGGLAGAPEGGRTQPGE